MNIEFVNHAGFIIESGSVRLLCDPWLEGLAFNDGWALLSPTKFPYEAFAGITHIWFSHEHPDHFSPLCIKKIPPDIRAKITVLYQATRDGKVAQFCRKAGFGKVIEVEPNSPLSLGDGVEITITPWKDGDSWQYVKTPGGTLLNLNDCIILTEAEIQGVMERIGPVDVLATQFSLSAWEGNPEEVARRQAGAQLMIDKAILQTRVIKPKYVLPFASFVWFCHEENAYINREMVTVERADQELRSKTDAKPIVMYPGDRWHVGDSHDSQPAITRYMNDVAALQTAPLQKAKAVTTADLYKAANDFRTNLDKDAAPHRVRLAIAMAALARARATGTRIEQIEAIVDVLRMRPRPAYIWVRDHETAYAFDLISGLYPCECPRADCDIDLGADSLQYAFRFLWGGETLQVNGRFSEGHPGGYKRLFGYLWLALDKNRGGTYTWKNIPDGLMRRARSVFANLANRAAS
jgi:UDP-MurNAc hydroxylase